MKVPYNWLKEYIGDALPASKEVEDLLTFHAFEIDDVEEVNGEAVFDVDVLPNRSSDCLSVRGIAREVATILDVSLAHDPLAQKETITETDQLEVSVADTLACSRLTASVVTGITVKDSPEWLQERLRALGQRPINNIVDATNYVMFALGQPMHAYDADLFPKVAGKWQIGVRFAKAGETVSLLAEGGKNEDRVVELRGDELLIVDGSSDTPVGLAGVKGGRFAELHAGTKNIILEAAHFDPVVIRKTARRLGILTDASKRFENAPSPELPHYAQQEIIKLIADIAGGTFVGWVDVYPEAQEQMITKVTTAKTNALLGLSLQTDAAAKIIARTGAQILSQEDDALTVVAPWERSDLVIEEDYIEEVGRIYGMHNIVSVPPEEVPLAEVNAKQYYSEQVRQTLRERGFTEVITSSFQKKGELQLQNALASDKSYMRGTLIKNIATVLDANFVHCDLLGIPDVRVFEIGTVFEKGEKSIVEHTVLTIGARTKGNGYNPKDDALIAEAVTAIEAMLGEPFTWNKEKGVVEGNFSEVLAKLPQPSAYAPFEKQAPITYKAVSPYPAIARDIALWVAGGEEASVVADTLRGAAGHLLTRHTLFDTFTKDGRTSYAFRLVFQATDRTLTDNEITPIMEAVYEVAKEKGWEVRG